MLDAKWFAGRLKQLREERGWSQSELSRRSGIVQGNISRLEQQQRAPSWETVVALCNALDIDPKVFAEPEPKRPRRRPRKQKEN